MAALVTEEAKRAARRALQAASPLAGGTARPAARPQGALGRAAARSAVPTMQALRTEVAESGWFEAERSCVR